MEFPENFEKADYTNYHAAQTYAQQRGESMKVLMSSWSPNYELKANEREINNESTKNSSLAKGSDGKFKYSEFGTYWKELVEAYRKKNIPIDYISIQNEPDLGVAYEGCRFGATETTTMASYSKAFLAVYDAIKTMENPPHMLGAESMSADASRTKELLKGAVNTNPDSVYGICNHLYAGGTANFDEGTTTPRTFINNFKELANYQPDKRKWETETCLGSPLQLAEMMQYYLKYANGNCFLYWDAVWGADDTGLINMQGTQPGYWTNDKGFNVMPKYYSVRHFSQYIRPGDWRVSVDETSNDKVTLTAYESNDHTRMTFVGVNTSDQAVTYQLQIPNFNVAESAVYVSDFSTGQNKDLYNYKGEMTEQTVTIPANGAVTVAMFSQRGNSVITKTKDEPAVTTYSKLKFSKNSQVLKQGKMIQLKLSTQPKSTVIDSVVYKSSNTKVASVSDRGIIKGKKAGYTLVTAYSKMKPSVKTSIKVYVEPKKVNRFKIVMKKLGKAKKKLTLSWSKVSDADGYRVYRATKSGKKFKVYKKVNSNKKVSLKLTLKKKNVYIYKVVPFKKCNGTIVEGSSSKKVKK